MIRGVAVLSTYSVQFGFTSQYKHFFLNACSMKCSLPYIDIFLEVTDNLLHSTIGIVKALASLRQLSQDLAV